MSIPCARVHKRWMSWQSSRNRKVRKAKNKTNQKKTLIWQSPRQLLQKPIREQVSRWDETRNHGVLLITSWTTKAKTEPLVPKGSYTHFQHKVLQIPLYLKTKHYFAALRNNNYRNAQDGANPQEFTQGQINGKIRMGDTGTVGGELPLCSQIHIVKHRKVVYPI